MAAIDGHGLDARQSDGRRFVRTTAASHSGRPGLRRPDAPIVPKVAAQFRIVQQNDDEKNEEDEEDGPNNPSVEPKAVTIKEFTRALARGKALVEEGNVAEGLEVIQSQILAEDQRDAALGRNSADSFVDEGLHRSLRVEVNAFIGALPPKGRQIYEERYGVTAAQLLEDATKTNDLAGMEAVMRRYFHTRAGYRAAYLVATYHLDHHAPLEGALLFEELRTVPAASSQWEPMLSFKAAVSWLRAGIPERCQKTLSQLKAAHPQGRLTLGGRVISLFDRDDDALSCVGTNGRTDCLAGRGGSGQLERVSRQRIAQCRRRTHQPGS